MAGIVYGFIALFGLGLSNAISKVPLKKIGPINLMIFRGLCTSSFLLVILLTQIGKVNFDGQAVILTILLAIIGFVPLFTFYRAIEIGKIGLVAPVVYASGVVTLILSAIFHNEPTSEQQIFAMVIIIIGILLISLNFKDLSELKSAKLPPGVPYALISALLWGLFFFFSKPLAVRLGSIQMSFIVEFFVFLTAILFLKVSRKKIALEVKTTLKPVLAIGLLASLGLAAYYQGVNSVGLSLITTVTAANPLVVNLYGRIVYKETLTRQQYLAIGLILIGLFVIAN